MLYWDVRWKEFEDEILELRPGQRLNIALGGLESIVMRNVEYFRIYLSSAQRELINRALDSLWNGEANEREVLIAQLEPQNDLDAVPGVYDILMTVQILLRSTRDLSAEDLLEVLSHNYQSILDREIISKLEKDKLESEVRLMEENNVVCLEVIEEQISHLMQIKHGHIIKRQLFLL